MRIRRLAAIIALGLLIAPGNWWRSVPIVSTSDNVQFVRMSAITPADWPEGLTLEEAWHLNPSNPAFSGFSALVFEGGGFRAISDFGGIAVIPRPTSGQMLVPVGSLPAIREIANTPDAEAAVYDPASDTLWLSYEHHNAIRRIGGDGKSAFVRPTALRKLGANSGIEAMTLLPGGGFLMLAERSGEGFLFAGDPVENDAVTRFRVQSPPDFLPTDMVLLPDGRVLVLLRKLTWGFPPFASMLAVGDPSAIREGETWPLEPLAIIDGHDLRENYEGLAVEPADNGALTIWLISDSNRSVLQRTLLLKLRWQTKTAREGNLREP